MVDLATRQVRRQWCALGCLTLRRERTRYGRGCSKNLLFDCGQICIERLFEQLALLGRVGLGAGAKLHPLEQRILMRELLDCSELQRLVGQSALAGTETTSSSSCVFDEGIRLHAGAALIASTTALSNAGTPELCGSATLTILPERANVTLIVTDAAVFRTSAGTPRLLFS
jgi:hypothetical protein